MTTIHKAADCLKKNPIASSTSGFISHETFSHWCCSCISGMVAMFCGGIILTSKLSPIQKTVGILLTAIVAPTLATEEEATTYYTMDDDAIEEDTNCDPTDEIEELEVTGATPPENGV